ncbi:hypothetical protein BDY21DRAFT_341663 [Lineolata rhizophorae]|uniref:Uncharacterized protein n=1 Tax=Lineolata rhizophorae TaxID=578093 RepID=A0A6A6P2A7_9PEZI|nr:hypothetical protein BDY21DRAFT_341663 [Lineolata rhizophorae]
MDDFGCNVSQCGPRKRLSISTTDLRRKAGSHPLNLSLMKLLAFSLTELKRNILVCSATSVLMRLRIWTLSRLADYL